VSNGSTKINTTDVWSADADWRAATSAGGLERLCGRRTVTESTTTGKSGLLTTECIATYGSVQQCGTAFRSPCGDVSLHGESSSVVPESTTSNGETRTIHSRITNGLRDLDPPVVRSFTRLFWISLGVYRGCNRILQRRDRDCRRHVADVVRLVFDFHLRSLTMVVRRRHQ